MATKKQELARFRNLTKGKLKFAKGNIENILTSLPNNCKAISDDEKELLLRLKHMYADILGTWDYRSKELINKV